MIPALQRRIDVMRRDLTSRFGWTQIDVKLEIDDERRVLHLLGDVVVPRITIELARDLKQELPAGWSVDVSRVSALRSRDHRSLLGRVTPLWQRLGGALATELLIEDGPVEVLSQANGATLVRALDGTLGWVDQGLGARVPVPGIEPSRPDWDAVEPALVRFLGAPYKLGGTLPEGVDCSGLLQRTYRGSQRILLPRHSTDQLRMTLGGATEPRLTGDLIFTWTEREGPCHVGALVAGLDPVVIHASLSRRAVVRDPLARFIEGAHRVECAARSTIEELGRRNAGRPGLDLPEPEQT